MATKDYGQTYYPLTSAGVSPAVDMEQMAESLEGRTVRSFTSTSARDTALATLTTDQKKGVVAHVQGLGLYYYTGSAWKRVDGDTFVQGGIASGTTQPTGLLRVSFPTPFGAKPIAITCNPYASVYGVNAYIITINDNASGAWSTSGFDIYVKDHAGNQLSSGFISVTWMAIGARVAD